MYVIEDVGMPPMMQLSRDLLTEIVTNHEGKGYISVDQRGFGEYTRNSSICILKKTKDLITGLEI